MLETYEKFKKEIHADFLENLNIQMALAHKTQKNLARHMGKSQSAVNKMLTGHNNISLENFYSISLYLNVPASELINELHTATLKVHQANKIVCTHAAK